MKMIRQIDFFTLPTNAGCLELGTELSPGHFRKYGFFQALLEVGIKVNDLGSVDQELMFRHNDPPIRNFPLPKLLWEKTKLFLNHQKFRSDLIVCLGGDCSIIVGTAVGMREKFRPDPIHILYLDGDIDFTEPNPDRCVGAAAMGLWLLTQKSEFSLNEKISKENITVIGNKDAASLEGSLPTISLEELRRVGLEKAVSLKLQSLSLNTKLFLHLDVDVLAQAEMPAAYSSRAQGLTFSELEAILGVIFADERFSFLEITEFTPAKDPDGIFAKIIINMISRLLQRKS